MIALLLVLILIVLVFIAVGSNPGFGELLGLIPGLLIALLFFLVIIVGIFWGGYYLFKHPEIVGEIFLFIILLLLIYLMVILPLSKGREFLQSKGIKVSENTFAIVAIIVGGVLFPFLFALLSFLWSSI